MNKKVMFFIHWGLQGTKIFYHEQISHENIQNEFFPNYGIISLYYLVSATSEGEDPVAGNESVISEKDSRTSNSGRSSSTSQKSEASNSIQSAPQKETEYERSGTNIMILCMTIL